MRKSIANVRCAVFASLCPSCRFNICCTGAPSPICTLCSCCQRDGDTSCVCTSVATDEELQANRCAKFEPTFTKHERVSCDGTIHYFEGCDISSPCNVIITADDDPNSLSLMSVLERKIEKE